MLMYVVFVYIFNIYLFYGLISWFFYWVLLELNLLVFLFLYSTLSSSKGYYVGEVSFYYFFVQVMGSFIFFCSNFFLSSFNYNGLNFFNDYVFYILLLTSLLLKMGAVPYHLWVYYVSDKLGLSTLSVLLLLQKLPIFFLMYYIMDLGVFGFLFLSMFYGSLLLFIVSDFIYVVVTSSLLGMFYLYMIFMMNISFFSFFYIFYCLIFIYFINSFFEISNSLDTVYYFMLVFIGLSGLPPFVVFFFKLGFMNLMWMNFSLFVLMGFSLLMFLSLIGYLRFFYKYFFTFSSFYKFLVSNNNNKIYFLAFSVFFFLALV